MTDEELARIKTAWSGYSERTHSDGCRQWHPECAVVGLVGEVERLRDGVRQIAQARCLRNLGPPGCAGTCVTCQARALLEEDHDER